MLGPIPKIIFFDMEGTVFKPVTSPSATLTAPSAWFAIAKELGPQALEEEILTQKKWAAHGYSSYIEWMEETILIHKKYGLKKHQFIRILDEIEFTTGVKETFSVINKHNIPTCLLSGGFRYQADKAIKALKIKHAFVGCEYFWDEDGLLEHWTLSPSDVTGKVHFMALLASEYRVDREECAFIGDGENDIFLAKEVGISIAFNASEKLAKCATFSIKQKPGEEDFRSVLEYLKI